MPPHQRSRPSSHDSSSSSSPRLPLSSRPPRSKHSFPSFNTPVRRSRHNSENFPPDNNSLPSPSPDPPKSSSSKPHNHTKHHASPSLPPRPPSLPRPSPVSTPVTQNRAPPHSFEAHGNAKRKLNLDSHDLTEIETSRPSSQDHDSGVKVVVRLRPMNQREESEEATHIVQRISDASLNMADQHFTFDRVAAADASQRAIFEIIGLPIVEHCLQGFNSSIFAYGQTGSGKTYTMWGSTQDLATDRPCSEELGLTPRVFQQLFQRIREEEKKNADKQLRYQCRCSFFEIYNEQITDLLDPVRKNLQVREDTKTGVYVENLTEEYVSSVDDVFRLMLRGLGNRKIVSTSMNVDSSRSHSLFTCVIESRCKSMADGVSSVKTSRMNLVDLAGSERQKLTGAAGERLKEAGNINRSLSQLGNLINILAEVSQTGRPRHIPYRDSRLTFLLQESLGGNAKLAMICAISPASSCRSETLSTLRFAQGAKSIKNKAVVNEETENDVNFLREQIRQLKDELMRMKSSENQSLGNGGYSTGWNARRSYNLLRMSLIRPLTLPHTDEDTDEEMEIEEEGVECSDAGNPSTSEDESIKTDTNVQELLQNEQEDLKNSLSSEEGNIQNHFKSVPKDNETVVAQNEDAVFTEEEMHRNLGTSNVLEGYSCQTQQSMDTPEHKTSPAGEDSNISFLTCNSEISIHHSVLTTDKEVVQVYANASLPSSVLECNYLEEANNDSVCTDSEISCNIGTPEYALKSPVLSISPQLASSILQDPPLSDSPRLQEEDEGSFGIDMLPVVEEDASPQSWPVNTIDTLEAAAQSPGKGETRKASSVTSPLQSSKDESMKTDVTLEYALKSPVLNISPHLASSTLPDSPLSDSPMLQEEDEGSFRLDMLPVVEEDASPQSWPSNITDALDAAKAAEQSPGKGETKEASSVRSSLQSSKDESMKTDVTLEFALKSPVLSISPHLASSTPQDSSLSDSPRLQEEDEGSFSIDMLPVVEEDASPQSWPLNTTGTLEAAKAAEQSPGKGETRKASSIRSSLQSSKDESVKTDITLEYALKSPVLSISPHLASSTLQDPTLSDSPRLQEEDTESFRIDMLPVVEEDASPQACPLNVTDTLMAAKAAERKAGKGETRKASSIRSSLKSSKKLSSPTDRLAASLHRGLQILENHQKGNSRACTSVVRFSFQNPEFDRLNSRNGVDKSVQTLPARLADDDGLVAVPEECLESMTPVMEPRNHLPQSMQSVEAVLAGAMRRERAMEETLNRKDAEIEQLNRLVRQYKHERECNALLQQSREDKIARLENLMEGSMPTDAFLNEEWRALVNEHKTLQDKYDHHPEVTLANIRQQRLSDDLEHYRNFFDLGERDALQEEIRHLRDQLQFYVESGTPAKQRRLSLTPRAKMRSSVDVNLDGPDSLGLYNPCERSFLKDTLEENVACEKCDDMKTHCSEVENEWMSRFEEKRMEADEYKQLAEKRKQEVEGERRCAEEMKEALQIAMEGHARLLDQYAELQEKHIGLLAKHRKVRDAMAEAKRKAGKLGFLGTKWFEAHAAELVTLKLEQEHERQVAKEQIEGLQAQVRDTADAVQAAGELLVRLKEAEEAVLIAQDAAAHSEQDVDAMRREIEKLNRKHSTKIATFQQRLLEARFQRSTVCPMCVMAERVKFQFTEVDAEEAEAALEAEHLAAAAKEAEASLLCNDGSNTLQKLREELEVYEDSEGSYLHSMNHEAEADEGWYEEVSKCNF